MNEKLPPKSANLMQEFHRDISYHVQLAESGAISLTGTLRDRYHDIEMEVLVDSDSLEILDICLQLRRVPSPHCKDVEKRLDLLKGCPIARGLNRKMAEIFGGHEGCGNLRTMLMGLLPLAVNARAAIGLEDEGRMLEVMHAHLKGTCAGFPET
ncbi:MAG: DUF2889 domain-containing protein [Deltaproteobacteria bacterium]|nr:DUF2889 domain-containing protein [Deltaproteobacteria bacterium]